MKAFIKPFEAPQRSVKIKIKVIFSLRPGLVRKGLTGVAEFDGNIKPQF